MQRTQETHLGTIVLIFLTGIAGSLSQIGVEEHDVKAQTLIAPLCTLRRRAPGDTCNLRDVRIGLPSPVALVGGQYLQIERSAVEAAFTLIATDVALSHWSLLSCQTQCGIGFGQQLHVVVCWGRLRINRRDIKVVPA